MLPVADLTVSLTGDVAQRLAFVEQLRAVADQIAAWTEADGREDVA